VSDYLAGDLAANGVQDAITGALNTWAIVPGVTDVVSNADVAKSGFTLAPELHGGAYAR
jgi:hypothetical protein